MNYKKKKRNLSGFDSKGRDSNIKQTLLESIYCEVTERQPRVKGQANKRTHKAEVPAVYYSSRLREFTESS